MIPNTKLSIECKEILSDAFKAGHSTKKTGGIRGGKRQKILHGWVAEKISNEIGNEYDVYSKKNIDTKTERKEINKRLAENIRLELKQRNVKKEEIHLKKNSDTKREIDHLRAVKKCEICKLNTREDLAKEAKIEGVFNQKTVDIAIKKDEELLGIISIKFITSSYGKNAVNYIEQLCGEAVNLHEKEAVFGAIIFITDPPQPKSKQNKQKEKDSLNDISVEKYIKMMDIRNNTSNKHNSARIATPKYLSIVVASLARGNRDVEEILNLKKLPKRNQEHLTQLNKKSKDFLASVNLKDFLTKFCNDIKQMNKNK